MDSGLIKKLYEKPCRDWLGQESSCQPHTLCRGANQAGTLLECSQASALISPGLFVGQPVGLQTASSLADT